MCYVWKQCLKCTCCDDIPSLLEGLIIKMVLRTQCKQHIHFCIAQVHIGNGKKKPDTREERFGIACRGTGPLHLVSRQVIINLETKKQQITNCKLCTLGLKSKHCIMWSLQLALLTVIAQCLKLIADITPSLILFIALFLFKNVQKCKLLIYYVLFSLIINLIIYTLHVYLHHQ